MEDMERTMKAVKGAMSKKGAAEKFKVSLATLVRKLIGMNPGPVGRTTVLKKNEEVKIANTLVVANWRSPRRRADNQDVKNILTGKTQGANFLDSFVVRNNLSIRIVSNRARSSVSRDDIMTFLNNAELLHQTVKSTITYHYNKTNITDNPGTKKVVVSRRTRRVERVQKHSGDSISLMMCGNAKRDLLLPMVVHKAQNQSESWTQGRPTGTK
ncbi:hypothetical protein ILUMI_21075 [Ignelater luminosus]|uniref:Uncharacterized protein n=1 Tax=Ignelater luminosus TaxID=2038154 RepID=A0A8K0G1Q6_IGNLU|nr:hypothetical protein ILUMI_21075 [Ignelater luminosus]